MVDRIDKAIQNEILRAVIIERKRQDILYGERNEHPPERWLVILMEEVGEVSNAVLEKDLEAYYNEFVQVAAVAIAALESLRVQSTLKEIRKKE